MLALCSGKEWSTPLKFYTLSGITQVLSYILSIRFLKNTKHLSSSRTVMFSINDYWNSTNVFLSLYVDLSSPVCVSNIRFIIKFILGDSQYNARVLHKNLTMRMTFSLYRTLKLTKDSRIHNLWTIKKKSPNIQRISNRELNKNKIFLPTSKNM